MQRHYAGKNDNRWRKTVVKWQYGRNDAAIHNHWQNVNALFLFLCTSWKCAEDLAAIKACKTWQRSVAKRDSPKPFSTHACVKRERECEQNMEAPSHGVIDQRGPLKKNPDPFFWLWPTGHPRILFFFVAARFCLHFQQQARKWSHDPDIIKFKLEYSIKYS